MHMQISFSALVFVYWSWFSKRKPWRDGCRSDPVFFSSLKKRIFNTELCQARYFICTRAEQQANTCDVESWDLLQNSICDIIQMDSTPFFFFDKLSLDGAAGTTPVRPRWY